MSQPINLARPNAAKLERALANGSARIDHIFSDLRVIWSPQLCPEKLLPWLAWQLSMDSWSSDWPISVKRERVRRALEIARSKGTSHSVREVVASFGGSVALREWWQKSPKGNPHSFDLVLQLNGSNGAPASSAFVDAVIAEVNRTKPVRSHFTFTQGISAAGQIGMIAAARPVIFARVNADAPAA